MKFRRVLVANRGEIALRIMRTCHHLGLGTVGVYSDADANAPHVQFADRAIRIGGPEATESYLNIPNLLAAAKASGADAIHPGYGFGRKCRVCRCCRVIAYRAYGRNDHIDAKGGARHS